jgi:translocation protein SEC72
MEAPETFNLYALAIDAGSKSISSTDSSLTSDLEDLNKLNRTLLTLDSPNQIPPPPPQVNHQKRSVNITKLRESGNGSYKKGAYTDALKFYDLAIRMASERPGWEPSGLVREELSALYNNRAQVYLAQQLWVEAGNDAEISVEMKKVGNVKGWWRRGQALKEMGRLEEAQEWVRQGLEFERAGPEKNALGELEGLGREVEKVLGKS